MSSAALWHAVKDRLSELDDLGQPVRFWLRDDDAVEVTPALLRLLKLTADHAVPLALAIVPAHADEGLARGLRHWPLVVPVVHGWSHANHAPVGQKKQEFGPHRGLDAMRGDLAAGLARMRDVFGEDLAPVLVPPWNRISPELLSDLREIGFSAVSGFRSVPESASVPVINTHLDIMDWHAARGGRPAADLVSELLQLLDAEPAGGRAIGILSHHLVHDDAAWDFLEQIFEVADGRWTSVRELLPE